jgi:hypothetical protein
MFSPLSVGARVQPRAAAAYRVQFEAMLSLLSCASCATSRTSASVLRQRRARRQLGGFEAVLVEAAESGRRPASAPAHSEATNARPARAEHQPGWRKCAQQQPQVTAFGTDRRASSPGTLASAKITGPTIATTRRKTRTKTQSHAEAAPAHRSAPTHATATGHAFSQRCCGCHAAVGSSGNASVFGLPRASQHRNQASSTPAAKRSIAIATVSAWSENSWPAMPSTNTSGRNTAMVVRVEATTAAALRGCR